MNKQLLQLHHQITQLHHAMTYDFRVVGILVCVLFFITGFLVITLSDR